MKGGRVGKEYYRFKETGDVIEGDVDPPMEVKGLLAG